MTMNHTPTPPAPTACLQQLQGTWKSDWELTFQHLRDECQIDPQQMAGLEWLLGKMTVTYAGTRQITQMPTLRCVRDGQEKTLEGSTRECELRILGQTSRQLAVLDDVLLVGLEREIRLITLVEPDVYYVYLGGIELVGLHAREYFRRVETPSEN